MTRACVALAILAGILIGLSLSGQPEHLLEHLSAIVNGPTRTRP